MSEEKTLLALDHNGQLPIHTELGPVSEEGVRDVRLTIDLSSLARPENLGGAQGHFQKGFRLVTFTNGVRKEIEMSMRYTRNAEGKPELQCEAAIDESDRKLALELYDQPIVHLAVGSETVAESAPRTHRLFVDELRLLADSEVKPEHLPVDRVLFEGFDPEKHAPITELHTHSSAQLSGKDLVELGIKHAIDYPTELLTQKLHMTLTPEEKAQVKMGRSLLFKPGERDGYQCEKDGQPCEVVPIAALTPEHRKQLQDHLRVPQDMTLAFTDFDRRYYRFVNPIVKNPAIAKDLMLHIARDFQRKGTRYAELSTSAMLNLDQDGRASWFEAAIEGIDEAKKETGVDLRFLISIPREYTLVKMLGECEKIKYAARHPYVVGWDLVGFEQKPASEIAPITTYMADWARAPEGTELKYEKDKGYNFQEDFWHRFHGGETEKKYGNVAESVRIAEEFNVPVRIAHALHEAPDVALNQSIRRLSSLDSPRVAMEFCGPSNIAYSNIKNFPKASIARWLGHAGCKQWFLGADGAGSIQTDPLQMGLSALASGISLQQLAQMRDNEEKFIARQDKNFARKSDAFTDFYAPDAAPGARWQAANHQFLEGLARHIKQVKDVAAQNIANPTRPELPPEFEGKMPVLVAGASKEAFDALSPAARENVKRTVRMLVSALDPQEVYFVLGRTKQEGITGVLDEAILEYNRIHPQNKFKVLGLSTQDPHEMPRSISWIVPQQGQVDQVPDNIMDFMHERYKEDGKGLNIFISGSNFTGYMIKKCRDRNEMPYLLMSNAAGASEEASMQVNESRHFKDGESLLQRIHALGFTTVFRDGIDPYNANIMKELTDASKSRVISSKPWPQDPAAPPPPRRR